MTTAFLFPGQGAQTVGMGADLCASSAAARELFDHAEAVTDLPLMSLCFDGPAEILARTDVAQPAIFAVSAAVMAAIAEQQGEAFLTPTILAGLSLGEYTALYAAGAMDFDTGVRLVAKRGELMQEAATAVPSGMVIVMGLDEAGAGELAAAAAEGQVLTCANFNCPGQIVLSGEASACHRVSAMAEEFGANGAVELKVAGAFHSDIMAPAAEQFAAVLDSISFQPLRIPVISNVDARPYRDASDIRDKLLTQLTSPVRWQQSMEYLLAEGFDSAYEVGPGRVLAGLMRRIDRKAKVINLNSIEAVEALGQTQST